MRTVAQLVAWALAAGLAAAARADSGPVPLERIALGELGGWIAVDARVGGRTGRWLIDTGASRNLVSPEAARQLGLAASGSMRADTPFGQIEGSDVELPSLAVGGLERKGQRALVVELTRLLGGSAEGVDGVLGVPWLDELQAELDLERWIGRFDAAAAAGCPAGLHAVGLTRYRSLPVISLDGEDAIARYVLDTGNPAGLIRVEADAADAATPGLALPGGMRLTVLAQVALGPQLRTDVPVTRLASPTLRRALGRAARGLAGTAFIDGARWVIDLARNLLCVEPGRFTTPGGFGLVPERHGDSLRVQFVLPGSPAERAGLVAGDAILQWAGLPAARPVAELWRAVQGRATLTLSVGEPPREVSLGRALFAPAAP